MNFSLRSSVTNGYARLGNLSLSSEANIQQETPFCILYTKTGSVPMLTIDTLEKANVSPGLAQFTLSSFLDHQDALKEFGKGVSLFSGLKNFKCFSTVQDHMFTVPEGYNDKHSVGVWCKSGKAKLDVEAFLQVQSVMKPTCYQALCDSDVNPNSTIKRIRKSTDRTLDFLDQIMEKKENYDSLKSVPIFGAIEGGWNKEERIRSAKETNARNVFGFTIEGFSAPGANFEQIDLSVVKDLMRTTIQELPECKPRVLNGSWNIKNLLEAIDCGIDIFDSSYASNLAENNRAIKADFVDYNLKVEIIDLAERKFANDLSILSDHCDCYCCKMKFTAAYISHLINTKEILAQILLVIHNLHNYLKLFETIRHHLRNGTFHSFKEAYLK
ncbi:DgyrCDS7631 [Dimorphilus gyrociliatus]|uniref:Queuine tRNA-ribosyltransferase accessory subunit 2 n=1 Tax=Dimorphilus gyrociliatus TaxID=2664684 RepID=A0A7I8VRL6_9ANNE|nr:DgyrCDS7631 [Dimorphilus gyrociliatus]